MYFLTALASVACCFAAAVAFKSGHYVLGAFAIVAAITFFVLDAEDDD